MRGLEDGGCQSWRRLGHAGARGWKGLLSGGLC